MFPGATVREPTLDLEELTRFGQTPIQIISKVSIAKLGAVSY